ncbi:MAG: hypothetical protein MI784_08310 [Cytophagales bacterium]|nr:hypothetical protein [Cytophagales bacterium]
MMTFLGVLLLVFAAVVVLVRPAYTSKDKESLNALGRMFVMLSKRTLGVIAGFAAVLIMLPYLFFWADPSYQYLVVYPTGKKSAVTGEGIQWRGFARITPWQKYIDIKVESDGLNSEDIRGIMRPIPIRFIDQVTANVEVSTRFQLPTDKESFVKMAIEFRSLDNLIQTTLIPTVREVVSNTGYMFAAQDYISGSASDFRVAIDDQLKFGTYSVEKIQYADTVESNIEQDIRKIKEIRTRYEVKKRTDGNGAVIRIPHDINENKIIVAQVIVDDVNLEKAFKKRLEAQRDESAKRQLEQQKIKTAKDAQNRIIAEGERDKAAERVAQEKEQVKALIAIETKLKQEETNRKLAELALKTEELRAKAAKVKADAEAYKNKKLVSAGLTPQEKAQLEKEMAIGVAKELAKIKFPSTMIISGNDSKKGGGTPLEALIGAAMTKQLLSGKKR